MFLFYNFIDSNMFRIKYVLFKTK